jgi:hypothetical protein
MVVPTLWFQWHPEYLPRGLGVTLSSYGYIRSVTCLKQFPGKVSAGPGVLPSTCSWLSLNPVHHFIDSGDYHVWALPWGLKLGWPSFSADWTRQPHFVTLLVAHRVGQTVIMCFHSVLHQLPMLVGVMTNPWGPLHDWWWVASYQGSTQ